MVTLDAFMAVVAGSPWPMMCLATAAAAYLEGALFLGVLVPGETMLLLGGAASSQSGAPFPLLLVTTTIAALGGDATSLVIGRRYRARIRSSWLGRRLGEARWRRADLLLRDHGGKAVFAGRFLPVAQALVPVLAGTSGMPVRQFVPWCAAGAAVWSAIYLTAGYVGGASYERFGSMASTVVVGVAAVVALAVSMRRWRRRRIAARRGQPAVWARIAATTSSQAARGTP